MRLPRLKASPDLPVAYYHCLSRVVNRDFVLGDVEAEGERGHTVTDDIMVNGVTP